MASSHVTVTRTIRNRTFHALADRALAQGLDAIFHVLSEPGFGRDGAIDVAEQFAAGKPLWWGFGYITTEEDENGEFRLKSLDLYADPLVFAEDLTPVLNIRWKMQSVCLDAAGVEEKTCATDDVILAAGWDQSERVRMTRDAPFRAEDGSANGDDSGWFIEPLPIASERAEQVDRVTAWPNDLLSRERAGRLVAVREEAVWAMNLPAGYVVDVDTSGIVRIVSTDGEVVFNRAEDAS